MSVHDVPPWALLRIWHLEAMEQVIAHPDLAYFLRTSYLSAPASWRALTPPQIAQCLEQVLNADYRRRGAQLRTADDPFSLVPFAYYFEWVERDDEPANPKAIAQPFLYPCITVNPALEAIANRELDQVVQAARPGIAARCYESAFSTYRVDANDTWHILDWRERSAMYAERYER